MKTIKYQQDTLAALRSYLALARTTEPRAAFKTATAALPEALRRDYVALSDSTADAPQTHWGQPLNGKYLMVKALYWWVSQGHL